MINKINGKLQTLTLREKIFTLILICFIIIAFIKNILLPQINSYKDLKEQVLIDKKKIIIVNSEIISLPNEKNILEKIKTKGEIIEKYFPKEINDGIALEIIGLFADNCNLQLLSFKPQVPVNKQYYCEFPIDIIVTGDFIKLIDFVNQIEHHSSLIEIKNMEFLTPVSSDVKENSKAKIFLVMYMQVRDIF